MPWAQWWELGLGPQGPSSLLCPHSGRSGPGGAADVRFSPSTTPHAAPGLRRRCPALREQPATARAGGVSGGLRGARGQLGRVPGSSFTDGWRVVQILPLPSPVSATAAALGPPSAATAVPPCLGLLAGSQPIPAADGRVCTCARVPGGTRVWSEPGPQGQDGIGRLSGTHVRLLGRRREAGRLAGARDGTWRLLRSGCALLPSLPGDTRRAAEAGGPGTPEGQQGRAACFLAPRLLARPCAEPVHAAGHRRTRRQAGGLVQGVTA